MKKFVILFSVTAVCIAVVLLVGFTSEKQEVEVTTFPLTEQTVSLSVSCDGVVQAASHHEIYAEYPCVAGQVFVDEGDYVAKGDLLFAVDAEKTRQMLLAGKKHGANDIEMAVSQQVTAPADGVVVGLAVTKGVAIDVTKPCASIAGTEELQIVAGVKEADLKAVKPGQAAYISGDGFFRDSYEGTVTKIAALAKNEGGKTLVETVITLHPQERDESLRIGLGAKAEIVTETRQGCLVVPYETVREDDTYTEYVYVLENGVAVKRTVTTGEALSDGVIITSGLKSGDVLIENPQDIPSDGTTVKVKTEA